MSEHEGINLALTDAARQLAEKQEIPLARRVRVTPRARGDVVVKRNSRVIYMHPSALQNGKLVDYLRDAVRLAHELDYQNVLYHKTGRALKPTKTKKKERTREEISLENFKTKLKRAVKFAHDGGVSKEALYQACIDEVAKL